MTRKRGQTPLVLALGLALFPALAGAQVIYTAEVDSIIHPVSAEFMIQTIDRADADNAALVLFTLRTPGGLVDSTRDIVTRMISAKTPAASARFW